MTSQGVYGGKGPALMGITWAQALAASAVVAARLYAAVGLGQRVEWDSIWVFAAWATATASQICLTISAASGTGRHVYDLTYSEIVRAQEYSWIGQLLAIFAIGFGKISIVALLLRIQGPAHKRKGYLLHFVWVSNTILNISQTAIILTSCDPLRKLWDTRLPGSCDRLHLTSHTGYLQGSWGAVSDVFLSTYPIIVFWSASVSWKNRAGLIALMSGGYIFAIAVVLKTIYIKLITNETDVTYDQVPLLVCAYTEQWLIIILGSLPQLRALLAVVRWRHSATHDATSEAGSSQLEITQRFGVGGFSTEILAPVAGDTSSMPSLGLSESESHLAKSAWPLKITVTTNYEVTYEKPHLLETPLEASVEILALDETPLHTMHSEPAEEKSTGERPSQTEDV